MGVNIVDLITSIIPGGGTIDVFVKEWRENKLKEAREIYLSEVRDGIFDNIDKDDIISIAYRLWRAVSEGASKNNFRLLCRLVQGLGNNKKLTAPTFLKFAAVLDSLSDEEIKVIAIDAWQYAHPIPKINKHSYVFNSDETHKKYEEDYKQYELKKEARSKELLEFGKTLGFEKISTLIPFDDEHYALLRTGLYGLNVLVTATGSVKPIHSEYGDDDANVEVESESAPEFYFTDLFHELIKYVDLVIEVEKREK